MAGLKSSPFKTSWRSYSGGFEEFGFVFGGEGCGLGDEGFLLFFREFGCGGGASGDEDADFEDEVRLTYLHELGHHFGWDEGDLEERGLA